MYGVEKRMSDWMDYLKTAVEHEASDVFFVAGKPACHKLEGRIVPMSDVRLMPDDTHRILTEIYELAERPMFDFLRTGDEDFSFTVPGLARFRVNAFRQRGSMAAVIRLVSFDIPDWQKMCIPPAVMEIAELDAGLVLVTGTAGCGKTTTQACIINRINHTQEKHIITLEDPIEFLHRHDRSIVTQREISIDTEDYASALRACVRQAPDVILLGEMRDEQTMRTAMSAAETGHMVLATLHTKGAVNAVDRIIDSFPSAQQTQIRVQLATVLKTVVCQQLLPDVNGDLVPAYEIMHVTGAVRSMIRDNKNHQIDNAIAAGAKDGMIAMDQSIAALYKSGRITKEVALDYADHPDQLERVLK